MKSLVTASLSRAIPLVIALCLACTTKSDSTHSTADTTRATATGPIVTVNKLSAPEALSFDPAHDFYLVSNVNGDPAVKDGNGFITRITADGAVDSLHFIQGGRSGVTLNSPTGSRVKGDTLWVLDVDALRGFNVVTGAPVATIDLTSVHPLFLNDLTLGPDGDFYITDTGVNAKGNHTGPDRIYRVDRNRRVTIALESSALTEPDGIAWDGANRRFVLAPFGGTAVQIWRSGEKAPTNSAPGSGQLDGIEVEPDGSILITQWKDSTVSTLSGDKLIQRLKPSAPPADVSMDTRRGRVGIVSMMANRFELWAWPGSKGP